MSLPTPSTVAAPPPRQLYPKLRVSKEPEDRKSGRCRILVYYSQLSDEQAALLDKILTELPSIMAQVCLQRSTYARGLLRGTFSKSDTTTERYRQEALGQDAWRAAMLSALTCLPIEEAHLRCEGTPWAAEDDLFWIAHRGQRHFPLCQFKTAGPPDPAWVALVAKARDIGKCREWELLAWLIRPHPILKNETPMAAIQTQPRQVVQLAGLTLKESRS